MSLLRWILLPTPVALLLTAYEKIDEKVEREKIEAYKRGCEETGKIYEAKLTEMAKQFASKEKDWDKVLRAVKKSNKEKNEALEQCMTYIEDLENERNSLRQHNRTLDREKQTLLNLLYERKQQIEVA